MSLFLSEHLPLLSTAPNGIQKLRDLILALAVRGKLVSQDPRDEPATALLERVALERAQLDVNCAGKKAKVRLPIQPDERPYEIPSAWAWSRFEDVFSLEYGDNLPAPKRTESGEFSVYGSNGVVGTHNKSAVSSPCIVVGRKGSAGALNLCRENGCWVTDVAYYCVPPADIELDFAFKLFQTLRLDDLGKGIKPGLSRSEAYGLPIPVPPLSEQHRIVAKVDELMALCDRLQAKQTDAESAQAKLVETLLSTLTQSTDAADFAANWQRLAGHFDTLFTTESSLDALKQAILQLAVVGKLVPQNRDDEPAGDLLKRIRGSRKVKRKVTEIDMESLEIPLPNIPENWEWTVVDQVASDTDSSITDGPFGANLKTEHYISPPGNRVIRLQNIAKREFRAEHHAYIDSERFARLEKHHVFAGDLVVAGLVDDSVRCCKLPSDIGNALVKADCYRFSVHECVSTDFALNYLNSPLASLFASAHHHGMTLTRIGLGNFRQLPFPLPPISEQRRIVEKVNELFSLCDDLKACIGESNSRQERLASTLIDSTLKAA